MRAREYLEQARIADEKVRAQIDELEHWYTVATKVTTVLTDDRVQSAPGNRLEDAVIRITEITGQIEAYIAQARDQRAEIYRKIEMLGRPEITELLYKRYFLGKKFTEIGDEMGYSESWVYKSHRIALKALQAILDSETDNLTPEQ